MSKQTIIQSQYDMAAMVNLAEKEYSPQSIVQQLEEIRDEYVTYHLRDADLCGPRHWAADNVYFLNELRNAFKAMFEAPPA